MLAKDNKELKTRKGRCECCGKANVTNVLIKGGNFNQDAWLCWQCACRKNIKIKPPQEKGLT